MGRESWDTIKRSKFFYVRAYRLITKILLVLVVINLVLSLLIYYLYFNQPERDYYATSGITAPIKLQSLMEPNQSDTALLPPDPIDADNNKVIPQ